MKITYRDKHAHKAFSLMKSRHWLNGSFNYNNNAIRVGKIVIW